MTSPLHAVRASGLRRRYGSTAADGFEAVRGLDLSVRHGELFALLGTNGAGKTSTMELIEGLARPTGGTVTVLGHDPHRERAAVRPRIGIMLQEGGFPGDLTVAETLRGWAGATTAPRPVAEALDLVGMADQAAVRVKQLSGGEKRRLDLAVALIGRPEVLFLDEPTTGLDPQARAAVWQLVRDLRADGTTVLLTTHYLEEAEELADRLAIMHHGLVVATGTVAEVLADQPARIAFDLPEQPDSPTLPPLPDTEVGFTGRRVTIRTRRLQRTLTELLRWAEQQQVELAGLDARSASLEEAFLAIAAEPEHPAPAESPAMTGAVR
ncbi:ABC transporter ATP-binding protein [Kitasatospora sp. RB6PN24]|uniref:ABC transporter ATP-binding protein n=1 Tax=Kitasatospora humi TaxID=2893891 RepID=UPI001E41B48C|nr:ABC transporter ATP-binding protein [Kitasatospora humi]MCC9311991.1 ABC transporter ATP-binding protein [Kitasatospora humi]